MISKICIENYKSIEKAELEFSKINVLIGPNGSGKSSVLECIDYFKQAFIYISRLALSVKRGQSGLANSW